MTDSNNNNWQNIPKEENPNAVPPKKDDEWEQTWQDVKAGFSQVEKALREAYLKSKDDPRYKKLGQDVKSSFEQIGKDIKDLFDSDQKPKA